MVALVAAPLGCFQVSEQPSLEGQDVRLTVLHSSDIHSRLLPYEQTPGLIDRGLGLCAELQPLGGAARLQHLIKRERGRAQRALHLDSGDCFQGAPIFNQFKGEVEIRTMAQMRPDAVVIGNHEFDLGARNVALQYQRWGFGLYPLLAANYLWSEEPGGSRPPTPDGLPIDARGTDSSNLSELTRPYEIINLQGLKVAVIGMGNSSSMTSIALGGNSLGITPLEPLEALRTYVNALRHEVDLIFVVSHMGLAARTEINLAEDTELVTGYERIIPREARQDGWEIIGEEATGEVRVKVPGIVGIDAIFGGHLHIVLNPPKVLTDPAGRNVLLVHSGAFAKFLGRADLVVHVPKAGEDAPYGAEIVSHSYTLFPVTNRVPKKTPAGVVECTGCDEQGNCAPTFAVEEGNDEVGLTTVCGTLFDAEDQLRVCEVADQCRLAGDACTDPCRQARAQCRSVPAAVDGQMLELLDPYVQQLYQDQDLGRGFTVATDRIDRFGVSGEDSPLGNLVADSMRTRNRVEAQFAMTNSLGIRTNMEAGLVTIEEMFNIFPFENSLTVMYLSGEEVQELFDYVTERSAERGCQTQAQISGVTFTMNCAQALRNLNGPACQTSADCEGTDFAALGTDHPVRCVNQQCFKSPADDIVIDGQPLNPTESYKAAVNDFIGRGGSGFDVLRRNTTKIETKLSLRDALIDFLKKKPEEGGPGRVCGSPYMVEPIPHPARPYVVIDKAANADASCATVPARGCTGLSGRLVDCVEDESEVRFYCIPNDFRDTNLSVPGDECDQIARAAPLFATIEASAGEPGALCQSTLPQRCEGTLHCCETDLGDGAAQAKFYCLVPLCVDPPPTGRIRRIVQ
ncbi:MAG: bifunctional metallophosphatase/5'-nucleotidase [Deltaproteobacteria bacterium]|nr:bifunctional metallophosphatase/5'-nucleotidase [Deltaproteobacteria bacterium]